MVTAFGKFLRNLRMDIGELLLQMTEKAHLQEAFYDTNNSRDRTGKAAKPPEKPRAFLCAKA